MLMGLPIFLHSRGLVFQRIELRFDTPLVRQTKVPTLPLAALATMPSHIISRTPGPATGITRLAGQNITDD